MTDEQRILKILPFEELLLMAAEEAAEKAQACRFLRLWTALKSRLTHRNAVRLKEVAHQMELLCLEMLKLALEIDKMEV